ncbi:nuclear transport factor 2 family protein [Nonomuraea pusilla]|uniref:nuclear transport factor 2 family protein n=1 Tax=Nonomuraea pusilla TaxID=46177 RepID=UPI00331C306C
MGRACHLRRRGGRARLRPGGVLLLDVLAQAVEEGGETYALDWHDVTVRDYGTAAVSVGVHTQQAAYQGRHNDGSFRVTHVAVQDNGVWRLAGIHLSPIAAPPGA